MEKDYFQKLIMTLLVLGLFFLVFLIIKPILLPVIFSLILAFIFSPVYEILFKITKSKNISALIPCVFMVLLIIFPIVYLTPIAIEQSIRIYDSSKQIDFIVILQKIFPNIFSSEAFSREIGSVINSFISKTMTSLMNSFSGLIFNFPAFLLKFFVMFLTLFYVLKEKEELIGYIKKVLPFSDYVSNNFVKYSKEITTSVLYGQVIIGLIQGIIVGISLFIFKVPNAFLFTIFALVAGIFPVIGPTLIWVPVSIYLFIAGNIGSGLGVVIFGVFASTIDNIIRPFLVSKKIKMKTSLILISMIGGFFYFGILGFILGPLIVGYLLIVIEFYSIDLKKRKIELDE